MGNERGTTGSQEMERNNDHIKQNYAADRTADWKKAGGEQGSTDY